MLWCVAGAAGPAEEQLGAALQDEGHAEQQVNPAHTPCWLGCELQRQPCFCPLCFSKMKGSDNQEKLVYQIIEDAGNKGNPPEHGTCCTSCGLQVVP